MKRISFSYLILVHVIIALMVFVLPFLSMLYALLIPVVGLFVVFRSKNKNNEVLYVSAYFIGVEVFLRMTGGNFSNEYVKTLVVFFMLTGMFYSTVSTKSFVYFFYLLLLIPGIFVSVSTADFNIDIKKALVFNLSGPVCLAVSSIYMFKRKILFKDLQNIILVMGLPIISTVVYLFLYNPSVKDVVTGTQSNFETSGGFGPNQVSTILGLGMFVFFSQLLLFSKSKKKIILNGILLILVSYRAIVTFSRGGVITGIAMIVCLMVVIYYISNSLGKAKVGLVVILACLLGIGIWGYTISQTSGLIEKRYANQDAKGRQKTDRFGGREAVMSADLKMFFDNPITGVGAGMGKELRKDSLGQEVASHNEITRMLSEHGVFGIFGLLILLITPFVLYVNNRQHLYFLSFFIFWFLTINHAAMRTAAPAFIYALTLLFVQIKLPEKTTHL
ncbi:O-antigen ligase family protein [Flavobacterium plurextorum]|uniref:O-antigen ligase family protein n=1 Tax=Flavobacterium TaxID=237 RepID=UPI00214DD4C5|nr:MULTISPECIES: O-antigen ligase family protein [Flavobacterium]UUW09471.1 O-antigen ligase family protein [Flavobacterium plurextorum]